MFVTLLTTAVLVILSVLVHMESLRLISDTLPKIPFRQRLRVAIGLLGAIAAHLIEILIFAGGIYLLEVVWGQGELRDASGTKDLHYFYYSMVAYTSIGFGDITPTGPLRYVTGMETLTGLVLIAWTASFLYVQMQRFWFESSDSGQSSGES